MPRGRRNNQVEEIYDNQMDIGPPQTLVFRTETSIFAGDYLKKTYWDMAKQLNKKFECSICLEEIDCKVGCERCFTILNCGHIYHLPCIIKCNPLRCPLCRQIND